MRICQIIGQRHFTPFFGKKIKSSRRYELKWGKFGFQNRQRILQLADAKDQE